MEIRPILSAMWRNRTGAVLVAAQIALTLAITVNALFIVNQRLEKIGRATGLDVENIFTIRSSGFASGYNYEQQVLADLEALRALPGVVDVVLTGGAPLSGGGWMTTLYPERGKRDRTVTTGVYQIDEHGLDALGVKLVAGRNFEPAEIEFDADDGTLPDRAIVTQALADELFPDGDALGRGFYEGDGDPIRIVGIVERMHAAWVDWAGVEKVMLFPEFPQERFSNYLVRTEPGQRDALMPVVEQTLADLNDGRLLTTLRTLTELAARSYRRDRMMAVLLVGVIALLVTLTGLGVVGLASFNVRVRTKQIGTRRAIGARRIDIVRYFLVENGLITAIGLAAGVVLTYAFDYWLVTNYSLPRLEPAYLLAGMVGLALLGQLATLAPARRAALISPAIATRTV